MNNITQIKRGSTASWSLGPEMVQWENLDVWGKDSLIHCEGTDLKMNVYTASANYFYDENGQLEDFKRPGLWLIQPGEVNWDASAQIEFKCWTDGPSDCWLEVAAPNAPSVHGQRIPLGQRAQMTVPYMGDWGIYMRWPEQRDTTAVAQVKMSIRVRGAYEELAPGQLGVEYTDDGRVKLKAGMPNVSKWDELPYIGGEDAGVAIIDVTELPSKNIQEDCFYRLTTYMMVNGAGEPNAYWICNVVDTLPEKGQAFPMARTVNGVTTIVYPIYYNRHDDILYCYINTDSYEEQYGISRGWHSIEAMQTSGVMGSTFSRFQGVANSVWDLDGDPNNIYCFLAKELYFCKNGQLTSISIGTPGSGFQSEVFNDVRSNIATGVYSHAEGRNTKAAGQDSHAEGGDTVAEGDTAHSEGFVTQALGTAAHSEGAFTQAEGAHSHSEGSATKAEGDYSHAEGRSTKAVGKNAHAEGASTQAIGSSSHAEGYYAQAGGDWSHAEGGHSTANGKGSHAEGEYTCAHGQDQHVQGRYNIEDTDNVYAHIVGNGSASGVICGIENVALQLNDKNQFCGSLPNAAAIFDQISAFEEMSEDNTYRITITSEVYKPTELLPNDQYLIDENGNPVLDENGNPMLENQSETYVVYYNNIKANTFASHEDDITYMYFGNGGLAYDNIDSPDTQYPFVITSAGNVVLDASMFEVQGLNSIILEIGRENELHSNAHTIDWRGNAWFAGDIYVGGIGQNDSKAKKLLTEDEAKPFIEQLGSIDKALDRIIELQESLITEIITFEIQPYGTYVAINGMTWAKWCDSACNTSGFYIEEHGVYSEVQDGVGYEGMRVSPNDLIIDGRVYDGDM